MHSVVAVSIDFRAASVRRYGIIAHAFVAADAVDAPVYQNVVAFALVFEAVLLLSKDRKKYFIIVSLIKKRKAVATTFYFWDFSERLKTCGA
jgi:hypothetical protein